ncbi:hypothetical protein FRC07_008392 [Ceratobasidium sp. 392]|nr:hypothetical protein FRC07_008392 [Ceratobasidium sp. 392]
MAAPSYTTSGQSTIASPPYSPSVTDGERILELRASMSTLPANLPDQYVFQSQRIKLDLGARTWPTCTPCYGYTGTVQGTVSVTSLDHVKRVKVTLECIAKASFMERGVLAGHIENTILRRSINLYTNNLPSSTSATSYPFSLELPMAGDNAENPLPPSFVQFLPGVSAEIRYRIRVDMSRSGLRRRESLVVPILYLPRAYTPPRVQPSLFGRRNSLIPEDETLKELYLTPKSMISKPSTKSKQPAPSVDVQAKIALPCPLVVASGDRIPFVLTVQSESPAVAALYTNVTLQLIKHIMIKAYEKASFKETIISAGEVYDVEQRGDGLQILRGELGNGAPGRELSWTAGGLVEMKHILRLSIKPPPCNTALSSNIPMFEGTIPVRIMTHRYSPDMDASTPALSMIGIELV